MLMREIMGQTTSLDLDSQVYLKTPRQGCSMENLLNNNKDAKNESLHDTYLDIVGYSVIGLMLLDDTFFTPLMSN